MESSAGGSCVGDALRELREALDSYRRIWPDSSIWIESSPGAAHIRLRRAVDAVLAVNLTTMEKRADRTEEWYERAIAAEAKVNELAQEIAGAHAQHRRDLDNNNRAHDTRILDYEAKVKELEDYTSQLIWNITNGKLSKPFTGIPDICEVIAQQQDEQVEEATATLTRQLGEEWEACDSIRRAMPPEVGEHAPTRAPRFFGGMAFGSYEGKQALWALEFDARREREKQNKGGAGEPAPRQTETAGPDIERDEESLRTSGASNHPQSAAITNKGGRPIGAGSGAAAVQSESTGEARSGGTPRVPANNRSGPHAAGDAAPILNKDETAQADPQTVASGLSTSNPPATVTEEDREMVVAAWKSHYGLTPLETITEIFATLLARIRHQRDGEIRELVDALRPFAFDASVDPDRRHASNLIKKHGAGK